MKKWMAALLALLVCLTAFPVFADNDFTGEARTVIGNDLNDSQVQQVYRTFGVERGTVTELNVTNKEERAYLEGKIDDVRIGTHSISCVYIKTLPEGSGLDIDVSNINWCTEAMYQNALITAGIYDAKVIVTAPFAVSGTAALTGLYKAYEDMSGQTLSEEAKNVSTSELIISAELADEITGASDEDIAYLINELKAILDETKNMSDEELRNEIVSIASDVNIELNEDQIQKILQLVRSLENLSIDELMAKAKELQDTVKKMQDAAQKASTILEKVQSFFRAIGRFFANLFGGKA